MDANDILSDAKIAFTILQALVALGENEAPAITALWQTLVKGQPLTDDQRSALRVSHQAMSDALQAPLPAPAPEVIQPAPALAAIPAAAPAPAEAVSVPLAAAG